MSRRQRPAPGAHLCDVPGCGLPRVRFRRLCRRCEARLPPYLSLAITTAHDDRRWPDHAEAKRQAAAFLNLPEVAAPAAPTRRAQAAAITPQRAYAIHARMLGEGDEA